MHKAIMNKGAGKEYEDEVYVLGKCDRTDEGWTGHDLKCRPTRLGKGEYTFVTSPDNLSPITESAEDERES